VKTPSVRARLTLWYAGVLAVFLGAVAVGGYLFVARTTLTGIDETLDEAATAVASAVRLERSERRPAAEFLPRVMQQFRFHDVASAVYDPATHTVYTDERSPDDSIRVRARSDAWVPALAAVLTEAPRDAENVQTVTAAREPTRVLTLPIRLSGNDLVVGAAHAMRGRRRLLSELRLLLAGGVPLMLVLSTVVGYWLAGQSLRPVALMNERLSRAYAQQREFMADASHELRTPVAIISGEAELALGRRERPAAELREALKRVHEESSRLKHIVADLFLLARAEAGEQLVRREELYLGELAAESTRAVRALAAERDITVCYEGDGDLPYVGDEAMLRRLVLNLLDNAIKYTPRGGSVRLTAGQVGDDVRISVADTGPGIPPAAQPHIFDRFYRLRPAGEDAGAKSAGGSAGLGLAIARWIAEAHGGTLRLTRSDASGSTFTLTLPAHPRLA
jgi:two-component system, OmpR family, sensor kinase